MPTFFFTTIAADGTIRSLVPYETGTLEAARAEARRQLSQLAAQGLPEDPIHMLSVEVYDERQTPKFELRLVMEELRK